VLPEHEHAVRGEIGVLAGRLALLGAPEPRGLLDAAIDRSEDEPDLLASMLELRARLHEGAGDDAAAVADRTRAGAVLRAALGT
jgi:hypothetical protein